MLILFLYSFFVGNRATTLSKKNWEHFFPAEGRGNWSHVPLLALYYANIYGRRRRVVVAFGRNSSRLRTVNELEEEGKECVGKRGRRRIYGA